MAEAILYSANPAMFRNRPVLFLILLALVFAWGLGLLLLFVWWVRTQATCLTVTDERVRLRRGILGKYTNDVTIADVRNVQVSQTPFQRIFGVGTIGISSSGQGDMEIEVHGLPSPQRIRALIDERRARMRNR